MAVSARYAARRPSFTRLLLIAWAVVAVMAVLPIAAGILTEAFDGGIARTAFATAPTGDYVVVSRAGANADSFFVVSSAGGEPIPVATVAHLTGYIASGAVSPDGRKLAVVAADAGTPANPGASLLVVGLESGEVVRLATGVDYLQAPIWTPASDAVVVTRTVPMESGGATVALVQVRLNPVHESPLWTATSVLGAYPVGFEPGGSLLAVVIDARGSTVVRGGAPVVRLSSQITRDWRLSPDGTALAFIDVDSSNGLQYIPRVVALSAGGNVVVAQSAAPAEQGLGVAWRPGDAAPTFGSEPSGVSAQGGSGGGFDVPLAWSPAGESLAVQRWSGGGYADAGAMELQLVTPSGRRTLETFSRFLGWAAR